MAQDKTNIEETPKPGSKQLLNDVFRKSLGMTGSGRVVMTSGVDGLPDETKTKVLLAVRNYDNFKDGDDPYGEHDFGAFDVDGHKLYWNIDLYDLNYEYGSPDHENPKVTRRVMTIMLQSEY